MIYLKHELREVVVLICVRRENVISEKREEGFTYMRWYLVLNLYVFSLFLLLGLLYIHVQYVNIVRHITIHSIFIPWCSMIKQYMNTYQCRWLDFMPSSLYMLCAEDGRDVVQIDIRMSGDSVQLKRFQWYHTCVCVSIYSIILLIF